MLGVNVRVMSIIRTNTTNRN